MNKKKRKNNHNSKMNKTPFIIALVLISAVVAGIFLLGGSNESASTSNSEIREGIQYVTITAKGGYTPRVSEAKAGIPTKLIMKTNGAFDCSSALVIRSIGYQKILPGTGETEIDLGVPEAGVPIQGMCSMGMYNFTINFI